MSYLRAGTLLHTGSYRVARFINSGGFGCTYEAVHTVFESRVAIKEFFIKDFCDRNERTGHISLLNQSRQGLVEKMRKKFIEEAKALYGFSHPGIVKVCDVFEENGTAYYVMEYVDGQSLAQIVRDRGCIGEQEAVKYIRQVADALAYVHQRNRLHLDVKPANILINNSGDAILIDFGASKQYDEETGENTSSLVCKTPGFAPPEQMDNVVKKFTPCTDVYALGATLYKCITGLTPPTASERIAGEELADIPASATVRQAIEAALNLNKRQRTQSIADFLTMLDRDLNDSLVDDDKTVIGGITSDTAEHTEDQAVALPAYKPEPTASQDKITITANGVSFNMVKVDGGTFQMGSMPDEYGDEDDDNDKPAHPVTLSSYYIGETTVTQALWIAVMGSNPSHFKGDDLPVEQVTFDDCIKFIDKLNAMTGRHFRLPTEAEWEFAARGGNKSKNYTYSGSDDSDIVAWFGYNGDAKSHPVKTKKPNELGIYDMSGNVSEWCNDLYGCYERCAQTNPKGPSYGSYGNVIRGGSWMTFEREVSDRDYSIFKEFFFDDLGLRLAL